MSDADTPPETEIDFSASIAATKDRVRLRLARLGITSDLPPKQQSRLIEIVARYSAAFWQWRENPRFQRQLATDTKSGAATRRIFTAKLAKVARAIDEALRYIGDVEARNEPFGRTLRNQAAPHLQEAHDAIGSIRSQSTRFAEPTGTRLTELGKAFASNPTTKARDELTAFFRKDCRLRKLEADRCTALVGNAFGWWKVKIDDEWDALKDRRGVRGSSAIRKSRSRSLRRDAARKTR